MELPVHQLCLPFRLHEQVLHRRVLVPPLLVKAPCCRVTRVQLQVTRPDPDVRVAPYDEVIVVCDRPRVAGLLSFGSRLFLKREHFLVLEGEHQACAVIHVALRLERRLRVPGQDLARLHLHQDDKVGLAVDVLVEVDVGLEVEAAEGVRGLDGLSEVFLEGSDEPLCVFGVVGVEDVP